MNKTAPRSSAKVLGREREGTLFAEKGCSRRSRYGRIAICFFILGGKCLFLYKIALTHGPSPPEEGNRKDPHQASLRGRG